MSETSNDTTDPGVGGEPHGGARTTVTDDTRMAAPSRSDVARGAPEASWAPSELYNDDKQPQPERAADFGLERSAQALGLPQQTIDSTKQWLSGAVSFTDEQLQQFDKSHQTAAEAELRALWGDRFIANFQAIDAYLNTLPAHAGAVFREARDESGRALANDPVALQRVLGMAQARTAAPFDGSLAQQIGSIEKLMREDRNAYNKDELLQSRYRELLRMREASR